MQGADHINFSYCSVVPRVALVGTTPPGAAWPSAAAGLGIIEQPQPLYQISLANCYQYGFQLPTAGAGGPFNLDHCDIWGGQNAISFYNTTTQINITDCWMHDWADSLKQPNTTFTASVTGSRSSQTVNVASNTGLNGILVNCSHGLSNSEDVTITGITGGTQITGIFLKNHAIGETVNGPTALAHQDGPGYLNSGVGPTNVKIYHNTIAGIANGNIIAFQGSTGGCSNLTITNNLICGGSVCARLDNFFNSTFTDNLFATDIPWQFAPLYKDYTADFHANGNLWARNKLRVLAGTVPYPGATPAWTSGQNGQFMWPDGTLHATDFV